MTNKREYLKNWLNNDDPGEFLIYDNMKAKNDNTAVITFRLETVFTLYDLK